MGELADDRATRPLEAIAVGNIRKIRKARGWSVQRLADLAEARNQHQLTRVALSKVEVHLRRLSIDELVVLAAIFGIEPTALLIEQACDRCGGAPPVGFTCNDCGREGVGG